MKMKYLKLKPFKDLQAAESGIESDNDKSESIETCLAGVKRHVSSDNSTDTYDSDENKKVKIDPDIYIQKQPRGKQESKLSSVQILGHELQYKQQSANVVFSNISVMELLSNFYQLETVVKSPEQKIKRDFISWDDLKNLLKGGLLDLAIIEALSNIDEEVNKEQDTININEEKIRFKVKSGVVYLEVKGAFTALGRQEEAVTNNWGKVDSVLSGAGLSLKSAFKRKADGVNKNRNFISLEAFSLLADTNKIRVRVTRLNEIVDNIKSEEKKISREFQQTVDMILRMSGYIPPDSNIDDNPAFFVGCADIIDLSSSESEGNGKDSVSSGIESEDFSPPVQRKTLLTFASYDSDDDANITEDFQTASWNEDCVALLGVQVPIHIQNEKIYLEKTGLVKIIGFLKNGVKGIEKALIEEGISLEDAVLYKGLGRQKLYLSLSALQVLLSSKEMMNVDDKRNIMEELENIKSNFELEMTQFLSLKNFQRIKYKIVNGTLFIDSQKLLELSGFSSSYFYHAPAKANLLLCKILSERGVNTSNCFLRYGKSKYAFITISAATILLRSDIGYLKDMEKSTQLLEEIHQALDSQNILRRSVEKQECVTVLDDFPGIKYKLFDGQLFLHRKSTFECLQLEESLLSSKKGYQSLNNILKLNGLDLDQCYLPSRHHKYSYISCLALLQLLQSQDPLIVCLANKDRFLLGLFNILQQAAEPILKPDSDSSPHYLTFNDDSLEIKFQEGTVYLHQTSVYQISGLTEKDQLLDEVEDPTSVMLERGLDQGTAQLRGSWLSLHCVYLLLCQATTQLSSSKVAWRDILSAVALYEPRMRIKIKIEKFKSELIAHFEKFFVEKFSRISEETDSEAECRPKSLSGLSDTKPVTPQASNLPSPVTSTLPSTAGNDPGGYQCALTSSRFDRLRQDIMAAAQSLGEEEMFIGDWRLEQLDGDIKMSVRPGYGASRKLSFLKPDFAAILRYCLVLSHNSVKLTINERTVDSKIVSNILEKTEKEGTLSFLCQLISLRPCFGNFSPELVETASKAISRQDNQEQEQLQHVQVDNSFVGTTSCGRTYAGTVRHQDCCILAMDRVSDVCRKCQELSELTINRSLLSQGEDETSKSGQKSVWKLATTSSDSCCFVCPQIQSFNTSLPHAFNGRAQASTVCFHSVQISSNDLAVKVHLSDRLVSQSFTEFQKTRHLGPLLDWVANLRLCVGYPSQNLVSQAKFIIENRDRIRPEIRKFFKHLTVDDKFEYKMCGDGLILVSTIRSASCTVVAETMSDICSSCRLLQEPMEFLID